MRAERKDPGRVPRRAAVRPARQAAEARGAEREPDRRLLPDRLALLHAHARPLAAGPLRLSAGAEQDPGSGDRVRMN